MPTAKGVVENMGTVSMKMFDKFGLQNIKVRYIPASVAYDYYLSDKIINIAELQLQESK